MRPIFLPSGVSTTLLALGLTSTLTACAVGGTPEPQVAPFEPSFAPTEGVDADAGRAGRSAGERPGGRDGSGRDRGAGGSAGDDRGGAGGRDRGRGDSDGDSSGDSSSGGGDGAGDSDAPGASPGGAATGTARVSDPAGDARGVGVPAWADLTAATLTRAADGWRLELRLADDVPASTSGDQLLDLSLWVDRDGDGEIDDEVLAQLGGDGWTTAYRDPSGARYGDDSGVSVRSSGPLVTVTMPGSHLGGVRTHRWVVGAEHGSLTAMTAGTASRDTAPDEGAAPFPG